MKTNRKQARRLFLSFFVMLMPVLASAQTVMIDSISYELSVETLQAEVVYRDTKYTGDVIIPSSVIYEGIEYCVTSIGDRAFYNCSSLTSITIPEGVTSIGDRAFNNCSSLTAVHISSIEAWCKISFGHNYSNPLYYAHNLYLNGELVTNLVIPESVTSIGDRAFDGCSSLTVITIPESVTSIGYRAFAGCGSLTAITIPESVTSIGNSAFAGCTGELKVNCNIPSSLTWMEAPFCSSTFSKVTIGDKVTSIGDFAFFNNNNLIDINIPKSVISIGYSAFHDTPWYKNQSDGMVYINNVLYSYKGTMTENTSINVREGTVSISPEAFRDCSRLTSITIPEGVTSIGARVFYGCSSLTAINIPVSVTSIGDHAFYQCSKLESVYISSIEAWCNIDFEIRDFYYFYTNPLIYAEKLFLNDVLVTDLVIPHPVTKIKDYAFYGYNGFTSITVGDGVREIKQIQFYRGTVSQLQELTLGKGLKKIEAGAFTNSNDLRKITIYATQPPATDGYIFSNDTYENATLYVPQGCISKYQSMTGWSGFYNISEMEGGTPDYLTLRQADNGEVGIAVDMGRTYKVRITPSTGWKIHTVTFDGKDMTAQLADDNTFTTPTINGSAVLNVAYVKEGSAIAGATESRIKVQGHQGIISIAGTTEGEAIGLYSTSGTLVATATAEGDTTHLTVPTGQVYIVKVADTVVKIGM